MTLSRSLTLASLGRLAILGCTLAAGCGGVAEDEAPAPAAPAPAALGGGPINYPGQVPLAAGQGTDLIAQDPTRALPRPLPNGCDPNQLNPALLCDRAGVTRWVPRQLPAR